MAATSSRRRSIPERFSLLLIGLAALLASIAGRLLWLQGIEAPAYARKAADQRVRDMVVTPRRGMIQDRDGEPLAISVDAKTVYAVPGLVQDPVSVAATLSATLGGDREDYVRRLRKTSSFVYIARKVDLGRARRLEAMGIKGIGFLEDSKRTYPSGELACQVLGFVGVDDKGLSGLERYYDRLLGGKPGSVLAERDPNGMPIPGGVMRSIDKVDGSDIALTIDKDIQYQAQLELVEATRKFGAKSGSIVVMDPRNGEILALASVPSFDPNSFRSADPQAFNNRPVSTPYEPGSTIKPFTAAAVLDKGLFEPDSMFHLPSTIRVGGRVIHEAHDRGGVDWSLTDIIAQSSNVGAVKLGQALGKKGICEYYERFGFGTRTGIDLPGESAGVMPAASRWSRSSIGNIPFGQGMAVTPLQLTRGMAAIAGGGEMPTPHLLKGAPGAEERSWPQQRVVSQETAREMTTMLERVVTDGTGTSAGVPGYTVAGKTGTAQVAKHGSYAEDAYVASFVGFLPANDPRVVIAVVIDEPSEAIYGGTVAGPTFSRLARFTVDHLKVPPSASTTGSVKPVRKESGKALD